MSRLPRKSDMAPLNRACRNALEAILKDRTLRVFLWCIVSEECKCLSPYANDASAREVGLRLLESAKDVSLKLVHQAEIDYLQKCDEDSAWRQRQIESDNENQME